MLHWEGQEAWLFTLRPIGDGQGVDAPRDRPDDPRRHARLRPVAPDGACEGLNGVKDAMTKHIIIISDGDPDPADHGR